MLSTPVSLAARELKCGQRTSLRRSSVWKTSCFQIASRHGPSLASYWSTIVMGCAA